MNWHKSIYDSVENRFGADKILRCCWLTAVKIRGFGSDTESNNDFSDKKKMMFKHNVIIQK